MKAGETKAGALEAWSKTILAKTRSVGLSVLLAAALVAPVFVSSAAQAETQGKTHHAAHHLYASRHHALTASSGHLRRYAAAGHVRHYSPMRVARNYGYRHGLHYSSARYSYSRLQCVPYAREVSHIQLSGDAFLWWAEASGRYARGSTPVEGAVLNFRSIQRMPLGHVAVVTSVLDSRTILVT